MATTAKRWKALARLTVMVAALAAVALPAPAMADPDDLPYGPDTCIQGLVWREARSGDTVCVTPEFRSRTAAENANPAANKEPLGGTYGPETCKQGFVWREAFDGDTICVTPDIRAANLEANAAAESNYQRNQPGEEPATDDDGSNVVFEITGSGTVYSIDIDPGGRVATENTAVPFKTTATVPDDASLLQVIAVTKTGEQGCRITVDGVVVVDQAPGTSAHCVFAP